MPHEFSTSSLAIMLTSLLFSSHAMATCGSLTASGGDQCSSNTAGDTYSKLTVSDANSLLTLTNSLVTLSKTKEAVSITNGGNVLAQGSFTVDNTVQTYIQKVIEITNGRLNVVGNFTAKSLITSSGNSSDLVSLNGGTLTVGGDAWIEVKQGSTSGFALRSAGDSVLKVSGKTTIVNNNTASSATGALVAAGSSRSEFNDLSVTSKLKESITINESALVTSTGTTSLTTASPGGSGIWFGGTSLLSLGESASVNQALEADRSIGQINIGQNATVKAAKGIKILGTTPHVNITVKGSVDSMNPSFFGNQSIEGNTGIEVVRIDGGSLRGNIDLSRGNDAIYLTSGLLETTMTDTGVGAGVFMGDGNDHFEATGGKIIAPTIEMGTGNDTALFGSSADLSKLHNVNGGADGTTANTGEITFQNISLSGYTDDATTDITNGLNIYRWNTLNLRDGATLQLTGEQLLSDSTSATANNTVNIDSASTLAVQQTPSPVYARTLWADVNNNGRINLSNNATQGDVWTIKGNYHGNNGLLVMDVELNNDASLTDRLVVDGDTSGTTRVKVNNVGGTGALTTEGIKIIEVNGDSSGTFTQEGRIVAGAYEYYLHKNGVNNQDGNWYLRSEIPTVTPPDPGTDPEPGEEEHVYRPEPGSYMANHMASNTLFIMRLHDRLGETQYTDALTGEKRVTSLWLRQIGGHNRSRDESGQLKTQDNRYVVQIGGDLAQWSSDGLDRWHLGAMAGYANQHSNTEAKYSKYRSRGSVDGYSAGLYATWYANDREKTGSYVDTWALYNWFDNEVKGDGLSSEKYTSRGVTASIETGYTFKLGERQTDNVKWFTEFGHLNRGDMLISEQHRCHNEKKKFQRRV